MTSGNPMLSRRTLLTTSGLAVSALALGSCAKGSNSGGGAAAGGADVVTSASWNDSVGDLIKGPIADAWSKTSGKKVEAQASVSFADYQTRFRTLLAGGQPPDVMRLNDDFLGEISGKQLSKDLKPYFEKSNLNESDFFPLFTWSDLPSGQRGLVVAQQVRVIYYNKTMFKKEGVPLPPTDWVADKWTWDDFLAAAQALSKGKQFGAEIYADTGYEEIWARNNGGPGTYSEDGKKFTLADPEGVEAIQWAADLTLKHHVQPKWGDLKPDQAPERLFVSGNLGMMLATSSSIAFFNQNVKDFEWDIAPIPAKQNQYQQGSVVLYIIPEKGKNPDAAWDYLNYAIGEEGGKFIAQAGVSVPINKKAAEALQSPGKYPEHIKLLSAGAEHNKIVNFTNAASAAVSLYRPQLERVYTGEISAAKALADIRPQVEQALSAG